MKTHQCSASARELGRDSDAYHRLLDEEHLAVLILGEGIEDCNAEASALLRRSRDELLGSAPLELSPPLQRDGGASGPLAHARVQSALGGLPQWFEWRFQRGDDTPVNTLVHMEAVRLDGQHRLLVQIRNLSRLERNEEALRSAALAVSSAEGGAVYPELVRYLAETLIVDLAFIALPVENDHSRLRMLAFYLDGRIVEDFEYDMSGTPCETVLGQQFRIYPSALQERFPCDADFKALGVHAYAGHPLTGANGESLGIISVVARKSFENPGRVESILKIFAARALTEIERERADRALRTAEASYRAIFDASEDAIFVHDWDTGAVVDVNPKACELYGYDRDALCRLAVGDISAGEGPHTAEDAMRHFELAKARGSVQIEWRRRNQDGSLHWHDVCVKRAVIGGQRRMLAFKRDITERKLAEEQRAKLEAQLRQAQKMEAIGQLTGGIAHDFNNILTSIVGYLALAEEHPAASGDARLGRYLQQTQAAARRARDLIQQMLTFSRGQRGSPRPLSLANVVAESTTLLRSTLPATMEIETDWDRRLPTVMVDPVHVEQVLLNLCINARDAMGASGSIRVRLRLSDGSECICASCRKSVHGHHVELIVEDTGPGIAPEILERMFEPFFSTKDVGKGSGMGLATVHGIVHEYGGHVVVDTSEETGTTFRILFMPLAEPQPDAFATPDQTSDASHQRHRLRGRVLVVEDEVMVGEFMVDLLQSWGLDATWQRNPVEAEQWFMQDPGRIDLVITDQTMPKVSGLELTQRLALVRPDLPIIVYTGYSAGVTADIARRHGACALLAKPVDPEQLFTTLQGQLSS
jgi:PAS domain S-box-containing protein